MLSRSAEGWDPEIEVDTSETPVLDISGVYRGRNAVKRFWREWLAAWESMRFEYELVDAGDRGVMLFDMQMRGRSTGIDMPFGKVAWLFTYRDGLLIHQKFYMDQAQKDLGPLWEWLPEGAMQHDQNAYIKATAEQVSRPQQLGTGTS